MQSAKSGVSRVLGLPAKLISVPEATIRGCHVLTVTATAQIVAIAVAQQRENNAMVVLQESIGWTTTQTWVQYKKYCNIIAVTILLAI
jgi:hypothetical protein